MYSNLMPLTDRLPPEGKEDPQINEIKLFSNYNPLKQIICANELDTEKSFINHEAGQTNNSEVRFTLNEFISYCENSNSEELKIFKRVITEKRNLKAGTLLQNGSNLGNFISLSFKRPYILALPKPTTISQQNLKNLNHETDTKLLEVLQQHQKTDILQSIHSHFQNHINGEQLNKIFKCRLQHSSKEAHVCWVLLSSAALYIAYSQFDTEKPLSKYVYKNIDVILFDSCYQWFAVVGREASVAEFQFARISVGDSGTTTSILAHIELYARRISMSTASAHQRSCARSLRKLNHHRALLLHKSLAANCPTFCQSGMERMAVTDWLMSLGRLKKNEMLQKDWLILWQDGNCDEEYLTPSRPTMEGHLMTRKSGFLAMWKPAYFLLKDGYLYQFLDASDQLPFQIIDIKTCRGCMRLPTSSRPHSLQILRQKGPPILIAASDDYTAEQWLQSLLFVVCGQHIVKESTTEKKIVSCELILTENRLLLLQHNFERLLEEAVRSRNTSKLASYAEGQSSTESTPRKSRQKIPSELPLVTLLESRSNPDTIPSSEHDMPSESTSVLDLTQLRKQSATPTAMDRDCCERLSCKEVELECRRQGRVLSAGNLNQISCIFLIDECIPVTSCLVEFECSEAIGTVGDWMIHFRTQHELDHFLDLVKDHNIVIKKMSESGNGNRDLCTKRSEKAQMEWISN